MTVHAPTVFKCSICAKQFDTAKARKAHEKYSHYYCYYCKEQCYLKIGIRTHVKSKKHRKSRPGWLSRLLFGEPNRPTLRPPATKPATPAKSSAKTPPTKKPQQPTVQQGYQMGGGSYPILPGLYCQVYPMGGGGSSCPILPGLGYPAQHSPRSQVNLFL